MEPLIEPAWIAATAFVVLTAGLLGCALLRAARCWLQADLDADPAIDADAPPDVSLAGSPDERMR